MPTAAARRAPVMVTPRWQPVPMASLTIDCDGCVMQGTSACQDCVVTFICDRPDGAVVIDVSEERALRLLGRAGLVPPLRLDRAAV
jgi:hypothetical protein